MHLLVGKGSAKRAVHAPDPSVTHMHVAAMRKWSVLHSPAVKLALNSQRQSA